MTKADQFRIFFWPDYVVCCGFDVAESWIGEDYLRAEMYHSYHSYMWSLCNIQ